MRMTDIEMINPVEAKIADAEALPNREKTGAPIAPQNSPLIARLIAFDANDQPTITEIAALPDEQMSAKTTIPLTLSQLGAQVVVIFENGDLRKPIIIGVLQQPFDPLPVSTSLTAEILDRSALTLQIDDEHQVITATHSIVLLCGAASITLTRGGKIILDGVEIVSRARRTNRLQGGSIELN